MFGRLRRHVRTNPASFAWFGVHGIALWINVLLNGGRGVWFWTVASVIFVSYFGSGWLIFGRRARRTTDTKQDGTGDDQSHVPDKRG